MFGDWNCEINGFSFLILARHTENNRLNLPDTVQQWYITEQNFIIINRTLLLVTYTTVQLTLASIYLIPEEQWATTSRHSGTTSRSWVNGVVRGTDWKLIYMFLVVTRAGSPCNTNTILLFMNLNLGHYIGPDGRDTFSFSSGCYMFQWGKIVNVLIPSTLKYWKVYHMLQ